MLLILADFVCSLLSRNSKEMKLSVLAVLAGSIIKDAAGCCAFGGTGASTIYGVSTVSAFPGAAFNTIYSVVAGTDGATFLSVGVNSTSIESSLEGFIITSNTTGQTLTFWANNSAVTTPYCYSTSVAYPDSFLPGFQFCQGSGASGAENSTSTVSAQANPAATPLFATHLSDYPLGKVTFSLYESVTKGVMASFLPSSQGCGLNAVWLGVSPFGGGAMQITVTGGVPVAPDASWAQPPFFCNSQ